MFSRKGFTILELLIVIAVIAILVGIALPRFKGMQDEGNIARAKGELRTLNTAIQSYYIHNSVMPTALSNMTTAVPNVVGTTLPTDPFNSGANYGYSTSGAYFVVYSKGPSGSGACTAPDANGNTTASGNAIYATNGTGSPTSL